LLQITPNGSERLGAKDERLGAKDKTTALIQGIGSRHKKKHQNHFFDSDA
jgi:hypothetical protein